MLDQPLGGDAAVSTYYESDLEQVIGTNGEGRYRLAQMEAAVMAGWASGSQQVDLDPVGPSVGIEQFERTLVFHEALLSFQPE